MQLRVTRALENREFQSPSADVSSNLEWQWNSQCSVQLDPFVISFSLNNYHVDVMFFVGNAKKYVK